MTLYSEVREAVLKSQSGCIHVEVVDQKGSRQCTWGLFSQFFHKFLRGANIEVFYDSGEIIPLDFQAWEILEDLYRDPPAVEDPSFPNGRYVLSVSRQEAAFSSCFSGFIDVHYDMEAIEKRKSMSEWEKLSAGYGSSRHGGLAE